MKNPSIRILLTAWLALACLISCKKELSTADSIPDEQQITNDLSSSDKAVKANIYGRILGEDGLPLHKVTVKAGNSMLQTDEYGVFIFRDIPIAQQFGFIKAEKEGYFTGSRTISVNHSGNFIEIQLLKKNLKASISGEEKSSVKISENTTIHFSDHSFVTNSGSSYTGTVRVYGAVIDPFDDNFAAIMPGDLRGVRADNSVTALISYGMVTVELETESGEKLQLAPGKKAGIVRVIASQQLSSSPSNIPLWHFDENDGTWKEEGSAIKTGNEFRGEVSHFSTWNFDDPQEFVWLSLKLTNSKGDPVPYRKVKISDPSAEGYNYNTAFSDSAGNIKMWVLKSGALQLEVLGSCMEVLTFANIGPFEADTHLGAYKVRSAYRTEITGTAVNCNGVSVASGFVKLLIQGLYYSTAIVDGHFSLEFDLCNFGAARGKLFTENAKGQLSDQIKNIELVPGLNDVGQLKVCDDPDPEEYVRYTLGDQSFEFTNIADSLVFTTWNNKTNINAYKGNQSGSPTGNNFFIEFSDSRAHRFTADAGFSITANKMIYLVKDSITIEITNYGSPGELIEASFHGYVYNDRGDVESVIGELRIRRKQTGNSGQSR